MNELYRGKITSQDWAVVGAIVGITAALIAGFVFVVRAGQQEELARVRLEDQSTLTALADANLKKGNIGKLREEMEKTQRLVEEFEKRLPSQRELTTLVTRFEELANAVNLRVNVTPLPISTDQRKQTIPFTVKAYGNFHQIASFINRLERHERYLKIADLEINAEKEGISEAEFTMNTYRFIEGSSPQPATQEAAPTATQSAAAQPAAAGGAS